MLILPGVRPASLSPPQMLRLGFASDFCREPCARAGPGSLLASLVCQEQKVLWLCSEHPLRCLLCPGPLSLAHSGKEQMR